MSWQARAAINTLLQVSSGGSPETFTTIAGVSSIQGPDFSVNVVDVTTHSNANPWRQKIPTLLDPGSLQFELFLDPSEPTHGEDGVGVVSMFLNRIITRFKLGFPAPNQASYYICTGFFSALGHAFPVDGVISANATLTFSGPPEVNLQ